MKKLEKITGEKYASASTPSTTPYTPLENSTFAPTNKNVLYSQTKEDVPFGYRKIRCNHCGNVIAIPMGFSDCPKCNKKVYADKNTVFLM